MQCHDTGGQVLQNGSSVALIGHPNVGKSVIFQKLTGQRVIVSNYPGTTVEVARGTAAALNGAIVVDTPGVITLPSLSEDEQVTARVLIQEPIKAIVQVGDAKNLRRTLSLTVMLAEMGLPMAVALNMMDEAGQRGVRIDASRLAEALEMPVVPTTAVRGQGVKQLTESILGAEAPDFHLEYPEEIELAMKEIIPNLPEAAISARSLALLWLAGEPAAETYFSGRLAEEKLAEMQELRRRFEAASPGMAAKVQSTRTAFVDKLISEVMIADGEGWQGISKKLGTLTTHPVWGMLVLAAVMYGLYWFVGVFGAGTLVGLLEEDLFGGVINPWISNLITRLIPVGWIVDLLVGQYGLWTMGITYAFALIFPIVTTFFLAFGIMEDSGYLPRLAALSNRFFKLLGLNGKAVLPMVLGLGCVTMATMTTRVLDKKRERLLVTLLLALAIPCSAQLGVVMGMLAGISLAATLIWVGIVILILMVVGWLAARVIPGERSQLLVELPPLRIPAISNVVTKTLARLEWYLKEVVPLFLIGTAILFILDRTAVLDIITRIGEPLVTGWLGLPKEAAAAFLIGFLRRDFGATGLFIMQADGLLSAQQVVVAMVTITLFIPCFASVMMIGKERGWKSAVGMTVVIIPLAFLIGGLLFRLLSLIGWGA